LGSSETFIPIQRLELMELTDKSSHP